MGNPICLLADAIASLFDEVPKIMDSLWDNSGNDSRWDDDSGLCLQWDELDKVVPEPSKRGSPENLDIEAMFDRLALLDLADIERRVEAVQAAFKRESKSLEAARFDRQQIFADLKRLNCALRAAANFNIR